MDWKLWINATWDADPHADLAVAAINNPSNATLDIKDTKLYVSVVTLSTENDKTLLEQSRTRFKRTIQWNKNNLNYLIDPTFKKVNRLSYHLKMKTVEHLFQSIMYQISK